MIKKEKVRVLGIGPQNDLVNPDLREDFVLSWVNYIDTVFVEHGFVREVNGEMEEGHNYLSYRGFKGTATIRFVERGIEAIPFVENGKLIGRKPIFVELIDIPDKTLKSIDSQIYKFNSL